MKKSNDIILIKIGGSLIKYEENLRELCKQLNKIKEKHKILIVPGGSVFTDLVRKIYMEYGLSETSAHFMAILGMDQFGFMLSDLIPESMPVFTIEKAIEAIRDHKIPILIPFKLIFELNSLPHSWKVTSDSIALFIAKLINAKNFIKLTDVDGIYQSDPKNSDEKDLLEHVWASDLEHIKSCIDDFFPNLVKNFEGECWILNGRYPQRIIDLLEKKETIGTKIIS